MGEHVTRVFFGAWEDPESRAPLLAILRGAATHEESANLVRQFIQGQVYAEMAAGLGVPDAELRIDPAMSQLLGIAYLRHVLQVEPIASAPAEELIRRVTRRSPLTSTGDYASKLLTDRRFEPDGDL